MKRATLSFLSLLAALVTSHAMAQDTLSTTATVPWRPTDVMALAEKAGDYQLATMAGGDYPANGPAQTPDPRGWVQGALFVGLAALADHSQRPEFAQSLLARGRANGWTPGERLYDADDFVIGSSYLWDARHGGGDAALAPMRERLDAVLAAPPMPCWPRRPPTTWPLPATGRPAATAGAGPTPSSWGRRYGSRCRS
ncbi:MAG: hypothetical protein WDN06_22340 [Asticcacaulis sp.]